MRRVAVLAIVLGGCASSAAMAAPPTAPSNALAQAAFAPQPPKSESDPIGALLDRDIFLPRPGDLPFSARAANDPRADGLPAIRYWPKALTFDGGDVAFDVSPHAGLAHGQGGTAEAGATLEVSKADAAGDKLKAMGVRDGATFGGRGRWYLFAAASGRAVGLNMLHGDGGWDRAGWSTDPTSKLVGDTQVGVGWRKGSVQTSVGYVHRKVKGDHVMYGVDPHDDDMVAFSLSVKPRR
jgi:Uncharacterized protein conserved in bacteria (DUF2219)